MSNVKEMRIFSADQINVPDEFPKILKDFIKDIIKKNNNEDVVKFSKEYFENLLKERGYFDDHLEKVNQKLQNFIIRNKDEQIYDNYYISDLIGDYDSKARLGIHKKSGLERAIKVVSKWEISENSNLDEYMEKVNLLNSLDHPNIVRYLEIYENESYFYFVSEYLPGGDLWNALMNFGGQYTEAIAATVIK